jgi:3-hydroxybutyrate dehydrogenase
MTTTLKGKAALVTGSTSGIGLNIAKAFAAQGADIIINGLGNADAIEQVRKGLESEYGVRAWYDGSDLSKAEGVKAMVANAVKNAGRVDILVNNAGIQHTSPITEFPQEKWDLILALMLTAPFVAIKEVLPVMRKNGFGRIINIASVHGLVASVNKGAYVSAKHGLVGLTKVVGLETAKDPITCNAICPGFVLTPLIQQQIDDIAKRDGIDQAAAKIKLLEVKQPSCEFVSPEQVAALAVFLCSDAASPMTGAAYTIDGGWTVQ